MTTLADLGGRIRDWKVGMKQNKCCAREIEKARFSTAASRRYLCAKDRTFSQEQAPDGTKWNCPRCGKLWEHVCDEAEGCAWYPA